jgi:hypothetical protein
LPQAWRPSSPFCQLGFGLKAVPVGALSTWRPFGPAKRGREVVNLARAWRLWRSALLSTWCGVGSASVCQLGGVVFGVGRPGWAGGRPGGLWWGSRAGVCPACARRVPGVCPACARRVLGVCSALVSVGGRSQGDPKRRSRTPVRYSVAQRLRGSPDRPSKLIRTEVLQTSKTSL